MAALSGRVAEISRARGLGGDLLKHRSNASRFNVAIVVCEDGDVI